MMNLEKEFQDFLLQIDSFYKEEEKKKIEEAYRFGCTHHQDKLRLDGSPYMSHPLGVSKILFQLFVDSTTLIAGLIHETLNHGTATEEDILDCFGKDVLDIVVTISKLNRLELSDDSSYSAMNLRKILVGMSEDVRVLFLKLADRLHNLRTASALDPKALKQKVNETMTVLIPIAHRLGMYQMKGEMEDLCLRYSKPQVYQDILEKLNATKEELESSLADMESSISEMLIEQNIPFKIKSRVKSVYSIYNKLNNGKKWDSIYDILALRVIVDKVSECYLTVGLIHAKYPPIPTRFKDYIAMPKKNMYQSLHTGVFGSDGHRYEIQIRTKDMDEYAEKGMAAHFAYKEKHENIKNMMEERLEIFRNLIESSQSLNDLEFQKNFSTEFISDSVYVFTPNGDVLELPFGSTPIDFAYRIHTRVGETMVGALVNDAIVPLNYELKNNDIVKIKTNTTATPNKDWLNFVKTAHARNKIKAYFSKQEKENYTEKGKSILQSELRKRKLSFETVLSSNNVKKICQELSLDGVQDLYFSIGSLRYTVSYILGILLEDKKEGTELFLEQFRTSNKQDVKSGILVNGESGILSTLANCCHPVYGDLIVGYITKGQGVMVHKKSCVNVKTHNERFVDVSWGEMKEKQIYYATVQVTTQKDKNYLLDIMSKTSSKNIFVVSLETKELKDSTVYILEVKVSNKEDLEDFMCGLEACSFVIKVDRK